jgi:hypothetical protein
LLKHLILLVSIDHPILKEYIERIKERHVEYCDALDMSIRPARDACDISGDAIVLCGYLRDETRSRERIQSFVSDMKAKARSSHKECKQVMEMLGSINQGLIKVRSAAILSCRHFSGFSVLGDTSVRERGTTEATAI